MVKISVRRRKREAGQAILIVVLAISLFMLGALGFAIDGSHLYAQRVMAQAAADAAAQAGMMSIFDGTSGAWGSHTAGLSFTCGTSDTAAACQYAQGMNGFNLTGDVVTVTPNPTVTVCPGNACLSGDPINLLQVTVQRSVKTTLMALLGPSASTIKAVGIAGIVAITSPTPIIITHPTMAGALNMNGNTGITITGGPQRSIQINSSGTNPAGAAYAGPSSGNVDLSGAGPSGTGGDFGTFGGPATNPGNVLLGTTGHYLDPASPVQDPFASVSPPAKPTTTPPQNGQSCSILGHCGNCPGGASSCTEYLPGLYTSGINTASISMFDPGIYYLENGGFSTKNSTVGMCGGCATDPTTVSGILIYDTVTTPKTGTITPTNCDATGGFTIDTNSVDVFWGAGVSSANLTGVPSSPYYGLLFFEDRNACSQTHTLGKGNGCFSIIGTIYITNLLSTMVAYPTSLYQSVLYHGTPCTGVQNYGEIIVSQLTVKGTSGINMGLFPSGFLKVRQVALVD